MTSYDGLLRKLEEKGLTKTDLTEKLGISSRTVAKISRGEKIADHVLKKIADSSAVQQRSFAVLFPIMLCCRRFGMKRASVCRAGCITNCRCG